MFIVWRFVQLFWPDPFTSEVVDWRSPIPRAYRVVICFAGLPLGLKDDLVVAVRCGGVGGRALDPRLKLVGPGLVDTRNEDLANQRIVLAPVKVLLDTGRERFCPLGGGGINGPLDDICIPQRMQIYFKGSVSPTCLKNKERHLLTFLFPHLT